MRTEDFFEALGGLDDSLIINARNTPDNPVKIKVEKRSWKPFAAAAACIVALVAVAALNFGKIADFVKNAKTNDGYPEDAIYQYTGDYKELELRSDVMVDYFHINNNFYTLAGASDLIVTGIFVDDPRQTEPLEGELINSMFDYSVDAKYGKSYNKLRVDKVFKGDVSAGDKIVIGDGYIVNSGCLFHRPMTYTPMLKGDSWVYFLTRDKDGYYNVMDFGRYPIPNNENKFTACINYNGAYDHYDFDNKIYEEVKIMLGFISGVQKLEPGDKSGNYEFYMPEFLGEKFVWRSRDVYALNGSSENARTIYGAPGIMSIYLADLNGDSKREMVFECWNGASGLSASYIMVYDHANSKLYTLRDALVEYGLMTTGSVEIRDDKLYFILSKIGGTDELYSAPLTFDFLAETADTARKTIEYNGKTYLIAGKTVFNGSEVSVSAGLTQLEYQAGDMIEVLAIVQNNTGKPIKLQMPVQGENSHTEVRVTLKQGETELYEYFGDGVIRGFDTAIGYHTIEPGDTYYQEMKFDTHKQRYDPDNTLMPLLQPLGAYEGVAGIHWYYADDMSGEPNYNSAGFSVNIVDRTGIKTKEFTLDEFPGAQFTYSYGSISAEENKIKYSMFGGTSMNALYLADLNGDGKREFCGSVEYSSATGITDERIFVYDFANKKLYELCDIGSYDYHIESGNIGGEWYLRAVTCEYITGYEVCSEPLNLDILKEVKEPAQVSKPVLDSVLKVAYRPAEFERTYRFRMPEFDGEQFVCDKDSVRIEDRFFDTVLISGDIEELYLADLNGDYKRELVAVVNGGHYVTDGETENIYGSIKVYDYANDKQYNMVNYDGSVLIEKDNKLYLHNALNYSDELFAPDADKYAPVDFKVFISKMEY